MSSAVGIDKWRGAVGFVFAVVLFRCAIWGVRQTGLLSPSAGMPVATLLAATVLYLLSAKVRGRKGIYWLIMLSLSLLSYIVARRFPWLF